MVQPLSIGPGGGEKIQGPVGVPLTFKARSEQTGGSLTAFENIVPPGQGPPLHTHDAEDESWYVVEGELCFRLGEELRSAPQGAFVFVPRGTAHAFQNVGDGPATILVLFTPSGRMEQFFDRIAARDEVDQEAFRTLGREAGMDVIGPPMSQE